MPDYSFPSVSTNRNPDTGIRYGIIRQSDMSEWFWESTETEYDPCCPECTADMSEEDLDYADEHACCPHCDETLRGRDDCFGDEPSRIILTGEGISGMVDSSGDIWVFSSPFVMRGAHCSPCAPGAVSIGSRYTTDDIDAPIAYCLPPEWFSDEARPEEKYFLSAGKVDF